LSESFPVLESLRVRSWNMKKSRYTEELRDECLDTHGFLSVNDARSKIEAWRRAYDVCRPHSALGQVTPQEFAAKAARKDC
jgi:putative transposase